MTLAANVDRVQGQQSFKDNALRKRDERPVRQAEVDVTVGVGHTWNAKGDALADPDLISSNALLWAYIRETVVSFDPRIATPLFVAFREA
jgi:hypothetical protein